jgi:hypothetical protein
MGVAMGKTHDPLEKTWAVHLGGRPTSFGLRWSRILRRYRLVRDGRVVARLQAPEDTRPWIEWATETAGGPTVAVVLSWAALGPASRLFLDGVAVDDGVEIAVRRAATPAPVDVFEKNVAKAQFFHPVRAGLFGALVAAVSLFRAGPLAMGGAAVAVFLFCYLTFSGQEHSVRWLAKKHTWDPHLRGLLAGLFLFLPLVVLFALVAFGSSHR